MPSRKFDNSVYPGGMLDITAGAESPVFTITANDSREVVRITAQGQVIVNPEFTIDDAARQFWEAVRKLAWKDFQ